MKTRPRSKMTDKSVINKRKNSQFAPPSSPTHSQAMHFPSLVSPNPTPPHPSHPSLTKPKPSDPIKIFFLFWQDPPLEEGPHFSMRGAPLVLWAATAYTLGFILYDSAGIPRTPCILGWLVQGSRSICRVVPIIANSSAELTC